MKQFITVILLSLFVFSASAQEIANSFIEKYQDDSLEVITIGKKMLQMMEDVSGENPDFKEAIQGLENIIIISSKDTDLNKEYYNTAYDLLTKNKKGFEQLVKVQDENENLIIMAKGSKGTISELILLAGSANNDFNLISLTGEINLETLAKYSKKINISGLKALENLNNN